MDSTSSGGRTPLRASSDGRASSRKVEKMSTTMVDLMTKRLLDVREVFGRLDKAKCGDLLTPGIDSIAGAVVNDVAKTKGGALAWVGDSGVLRRRARPGC